MYTKTQRSATSNNLLSLNILFCLYGYQISKTLRNIPANETDGHSKNMRSNMAQVRCGMLPLRVETRWFRGEPLDDRICLFDLNEIETEEHFLLKKVII